MGDEFELIEWESLKNKELSILASNKRKLEILKASGYDIDEENFIVDKNTRDRIINPNDEDPIKYTESLAIFTGGSHHFVRNVADYSRLLAEEDKLKLTAEA